jgi:glycosyltransferase involved in cell wall biosynthesis
VTPDRASAPALVIVDARMVRRRRTGVATYIRELRAALGETRHGDVRVEWLTGPPGLPRRGRLTSAGNLALDLAWLHVWLPLAAWRRRARLIHAPVNWAPWWSPCPVAATVHDLSWERTPDAYPAGFRRYARLFGRRTARRARVVIAVSRATAEDLAALYGTPHERLRVVPYGIRVDDGPGEPREPFLLSVGELHPRKRVPALVEGHRRYLESAPADPPPCRLVIAGAGGSDEEAVRRVAGPGCELLGFVERDRLVDLYRRATLLVYPSAYEGFGLPVLEAMAHGCPALVARNSSLPEVGGAAALYLDDATPAGIARRLGEVLGDRAALAERGAASRRHAATFAWPAAAAATLDAYREAME